MINIEHMIICVYHFFSQIGLVASSALMKLPAVALKKGGFMKYSSLNPKLAPRWREIAPYVPVIKAVLKVTGGLNLVQASMLDAFKK